jgi:hypothetical protein
MKFTTKEFPQGKNILANDHYVAIPYDCSALTSLATNGVIPEGTIIPANNATAKGVLLNPVVLAENPNGTIVIHGFINKSKLPVAPADTVAIPQVVFMD